MRYLIGALSVLRHSGGIVLHPDCEGLPVLIENSEIPELSAFNRAVEVSEISRTGQTLFRLLRESGVLIPDVQALAHIRRWLPGGIRRDLPLAIPVRSADGRLAADIRTRFPQRQVVFSSGRREEPYGDGVDVVDVPSLQRLCAPVIRDDPHAWDFLFNSDPNHPCDTGAQRNRLQAHFAGRQFFGLDSDMIPRWIRTGDPASLVITDNQTGRTVKRYLKESEIRNYRAPGYEEPWDAMDHLLQESSAVLLEASLTSDSRTRSYLRERTGTVDVVMFGYHGRSGEHSPFSVLIYENAWDLSSRQYARARYAGNRLNSETAFRLSAHPSFVPGGYIDLSLRIKPPFLPVARSQDTLWGLMLRRLYNDSFTLKPPYALMNDRLSELKFSEDQLFHHFRNTADFFLRSVRSWDPPNTSNDGPARLRLLGGHLRNIAGLGEREFLDYHLTLLHEMTGNLTAMCAALIEAHPEGCELWRSDMRRFVSRLENLDGDPASVRPMETVPASESDRGLKMLRKWFDLFGRSLVLWPDIYRTLADAGPKYQ
jgi:hypothetical protein